MKMDRNIKMIIYTVFNFVGLIFLISLNQFNVFSYLFAIISTYLSRWCYRG